MAVSDISTFSGPFIADGVSGTFPYYFDPASDAEIAAKVNDAPFVISSVDLVNRRVTLAPIPPNGAIVYILSDPSFAQDVKFENGSRWLAEPVNEVNDRGAIRDQYLRDRVMRAPQTPMNPADAAGKFAVVDAGGEWAFATGTGADAGLRTDLAASTGARLVGFQQNGIGAAARAIEDKARERVTAQDFGAKGDGTTNDTTALANTLLASPTPLITPATFLTVAPQVVRSGMTLNLSAGSVLRQGSGGNNNVIANAAYFAPWVDVSGNVFWADITKWQAQITVPGGLSAIGNPGIGDAVWLDGADQGAYNGVFDIIQVINSSNIMVRLKRRPTANPTGTLRVKKADKDIVIDARGSVLDYNQAQNADSTPGPQTHLMLFAGVRNLTIIGPRFTNTKKFALCLGAVNGGKITDIQGWGLGSDLLKLYGPIWDVVVDGITGTPGDDFISVQCIEPAAFSAYRFSKGDVMDIQLRNIHCEQSASPFVSIYPTSADLVIDNILIEHVTGHTDLYAVQVYDYEGGGKVGNVKIRDLNAICQQGVRVAAATGSTTVRSIDVEFGPDFQPSTGSDFINVDASASIDRLRISGAIDNSQIGTGALASIAGQVRVLQFDSLRYKVNALFLVSWSGAAKTLETCTFSACDIDMQGTMFRGSGVSFSGNPTISANGGKLKSATNLFEVASTMTISFNGVRVAPGTQAVTAIGGSAPIVTVNATGNTLASGEWATATGDAKVNPRSYDISINLNASWVNRATGNFLTTPAATGSGGATDIQAGAMAFCQGTATGSWKQLSDATRSY